jgi:hypothetical protein
MYFFYNSPIPELILRFFNQKRLQRIANLIAHVRVRQVQARQHRCLQFLLARLFAVDQITNQHVQEDNIGWVDEGNILQTKDKNSIKFLNFSIFKLFSVHGLRQSKQLNRFSFVMMFVLLAKAFISMTQGDAVFFAFVLISADSINEYLFGLW